MKRFLCLILVIAIAALTGCASGRKEESGVRTVTIWHDKEDAVIEVLENALKGLESEIKVVFEKKTGLTESLKLVGNDANAAPDLYFFAHDKIGVYAEMGILVPVTEILGADALDGYVNLAASGAEYKGNIYQMPLYFETLLFMYNKKYMKAEDIPSTTEQLYEYMVRKTKYGHYGFVEQHSTPYYAAGWIHGFGGSLISEDGMPLLDTENVRRAVEYHRKFVGYMTGETEYAMVNTLFTSGMAHATIAGPWFVPTVRAAGIDVGIASMPVVDETGLALAPYSGIQGLHVIRARYEKNAEAIKTVLKTLQKPEIMIALSKASGCAPAMEVCYEDASVQADELIMAMRRTAENAYPMPNIPEMDVMWTVAGNLLTDVNMSGKDVHQAASEAQKKALQLIEAMK